MSINKPDIRKESAMRTVCLTKSMNNKKGFTLVELVVVIAILAILAAIAIPAVIGIVNNASDTALESEAVEIDQACKTYYAAIKSGVITKENYTFEYVSDELPSEKVSFTKKMQKAKDCTVAGALEYGGIYDLVGRLEEYAYDSQGNIKAAQDPLQDGFTRLKSDGSTTIGELNYGT